ncbi:hypothetical protein H696_00549 [Fonticula alba]|uniref:Charged multivesicular body protein 5 n=1 Tax=Fonticula alba TaxID=691883 RepID=A0A058ZF77_FONAL|nr:hypothetical protein H696_00549 [Fonticula alba]KCV72999.1 hypothetical protein H696_00549 [Fonticula alba]|eukprot:XP_009492700.1 hypothetical protein H696_00549 [Fonticula alba]
MNRIFGSSSSAAKAPPPSAADTVNRLESRADVIQVKIDKIDAELKTIQTRLSKMTEGSAKQQLKNKAIMLIRQKRGYEQQKNSMLQTAFSVDQVQMTTENLRLTIDTAQTMKQTAKDMKREYKRLDINKIEAIQDDLQDMMDQANEIQEIMGRGYDVPDYIDEADLESELAGLGDTLFEDADGLPSYLTESLPAPASGTIGLDNATKEGQAAQPATGERLPQLV